MLKDTIKTAAIVGIAFLTYAHAAQLYVKVDAQVRADRYQSIVNTVAESFVK